MNTAPQALVEAVFQAVTAFNNSRGLRTAELRSYLDRHYAEIYGAEELNAALAQLKTEGKVEWRHSAYFLASGRRRA
jgi:hypothetical protein